MQSEDTSLVGQCLGGKPEAYGRLVEKYSGRIINLAYAMMSDRHEAEDRLRRAALIYNFPSNRLSLN